MTAFSSVERGAAVFPHAFTAGPLQNVTRSVDDELEDLEKMLNAASYRRDRNPFVVAVYGAFDLDRDDGRVESRSKRCRDP